MLSSGINPNNCIIFKQSSVLYHTQLSWILDCITPMGNLKRMTQFKDKSDQKGALTGLFTYPILMAADILLYKTNCIIYIIKMFLLVMINYNMLN